MTTIHLPGQARRSHATSKYLFLPRCETSDIAELLRACFWSGVQPVRWAPGDPWAPPEDCSLANTTVYGGLRNGRLVAEHLGGRLLEPAPELLPALPRDFLNRAIELTTIGAARNWPRPAFMKPAVGKTFPTGIYGPGARALPTHEGGSHGDGDSRNGDDPPVPRDLFSGEPLPEDLPVLVGEIVEWEIEVRTFVLGGAVRASSPYALHHAVPCTSAQRAEALAFCARVLADPRVALPRAVVLDVGVIRGRGWSIVEANPLAASSLYGCDPSIVLDLLFHGIERVQP